MDSAEQARAVLSMEGARHSLHDSQIEPFFGSEGIKRDMRASLQVSVSAFFEGLSPTPFDGCLLDWEIAAPTRWSLPSCSRPSRTLRAAGAVARRRAILDRRCARRHVARAGRDGRMAAIEQKDGAAAQPGDAVMLGAPGGRRYFPLPLPRGCRENRKRKRASGAMSCCRLSQCSRRDCRASAVSDRRGDNLGRTCRDGRRR